MRAWLSVISALGCSCGPSDAQYVATVQAHVAKGPVVACCQVEGRALDAACAAEAATRCAFAGPGASMRATKVTRFGENDGATVEATFEGWGAAATCSYQVLNFPPGTLHVQGGFCLSR